MITTSGYGPDSYKFAGGKPLNLIDGSGLLALCQQYEIPAGFSTTPKENRPPDGVPAQRPRVPMATTLDGSPSRTAVSSRWLIRPPGGPRLVLVHRPEAVMGYTHSHRCWVVIAPVRGVETH
jgi:hypothetical protein